MPSKKKSTSTEFNNKNNHQLGAGFVYQWWASLMLQRLFSGKYFPKINRHVIKKPSQFGNSANKLSKINCKEEYNYAKAVFNIKKWMGKNHDKPYVLVEGEDGFFEDINLLSPWITWAHDRISLIQSKSSKNSTIGKTAIIQSLVKFTSNENLLRITHNNYLRHKDLSDKIDFYIIVNGKNHADFVQLSRSLKNKKRNTDSIASIVIDILCNMTKSLVQTNGKKVNVRKYPTRSKLLTNTSINQSIIDILKALSSYNWKLADKKWSDLDNLYPGIYCDIKKSAVVAQNTILIDNLDFLILKKSIESSFRPKAKSMHAFYEVVEKSVSKDFPSRKQRKVAEQFNNTYFHEKGPHDLQNQWKFLL